MMPHLPPELIQLIFTLVENRPTLHTLLFVSHQFHLIAEPLLYADVSLGFDSNHSRYPSKYVLITIGSSFLRAITTLTGGRCARHVHQLTLPANAFERNTYGLCFRSILQHLPNLQHLHVESCQGFYDPVGFSTIPASLTRFSWDVEQGFLDTGAFARFIDDQPFLEHLHIPWVVKPLTSIRQSSLGRLRVLHAHITTAPSILLGRHVTHLKIEGCATINNAEWRTLDTDALHNVVVLVAHYVSVKCLSSSALSRMPNLECLQVSPRHETTTETFESIVTVNPPRLRHLRWYARQKSFSTLISSRHVSSTFAGVPSLSCISNTAGYVTVSGLTYPVYEFFFATGRMETLRPSDLSRSQWWQDWEIGYDVQTPMD